MSSIRIEEDEVVLLLKDLVSISSVNPSIEGEHGEIELSHFIAEFLEKAGIKVQTQDVADGRFNVIGTLKGTEDGRRLMFNGHTDTVGVRNMSIDPFEPLVENDRLHGRGACDMKASIAAMMVALKSLAESKSTLKGDVVISTVVGEEFDNAGTKKLISDPRFSNIADGVIVGEPTALQLAITHKGYALAEFETQGKAAHGSMPEKGIDAIEKMARVVLKIEDLKKEYGLKSHEMLGSPKIHTSIIQGGREWSVIPDQCILKIEARTIPKHGSREVMQDLQRIIQEFASKDHDFKATVKLVDAGEPLETSPNEPLVKTLRAAFRETKNADPQIVGVPYYTEASLFSGKLGIPSCLIGAGDIQQAHAADEFVKISEVIEAAEIYALAAQNFGET
jgi:acetylornithine deacetylase